MMLHQTFSLLDIPKVLLLVLLECALSADNAIVLATIIRPLSPKKRNKALWIGLGSGIFLRIGAIILLAYLIQLFWIQLAGAAYLLYLAISHHVKKHYHPLQKIKEKPLWQVIIHIECIDLVFAMDSIIAALALVGIAHGGHGELSDKIWIVYLGGIIGLALMRMTAKAFASMMDKFTNLDKAAYYLVGWVGIKLGFQALYHRFTAIADPNVSLYSGIVFWGVTIAILAYGIIPKRTR